MTLDETGNSEVLDLALAKEINDAAYHGADIRPAWIGSRWADTPLDSLRGLMSWTNTHRSFYLNFVRDYMEKAGDVLDIGCGAGQATSMLSRYSNLAVGIDSDESVIKFARKYNTDTGAIFVMGLFPWDAEAHWRYDYIFCVETMEHIRYEHQHGFLTKALGMLNEGGRMFITTPNEDTPAAPHVGVWNKQWADQIAVWLGERVVRRGYFCNTDPAKGIQDHPSTHHAWVLK